MVLEERWAGSEARGKEGLTLNKVIRNYEGFDFQGTEKGTRELAKA